MLTTLIVIRQLSFKVSDNWQLKKYTKREKISILMKMEFDSEPVYGDNDKCIKAKSRSYEDKVKKKIQGKKIPK